MNPKILIVENDPEMAEVLQHGFEQEQLAPTIAGDGETGLRLAQQGSFETIVLDVMLPGMDGFDVARSLRQAGNRIPILLLTARDSVSDVDYLGWTACGATPPPRWDETRDRFPVPTQLSRSQRLSRTAGMAR